MAHHVYDQQGHLLAEPDGDTGAVIKQYIRLDDTPLAVSDIEDGSDVHEARWISSRPSAAIPNCSNWPMTAIPARS